MIAERQLEKLRQEPQELSSGLRFTPRFDCFFQSNSKKKVHPPSTKEPSCTQVIPKTNSSNYVPRAERWAYLTMLNTLCNMTNSTLKAEDHRIALESAVPTGQAAAGPAITTHPTALRAGIDQAP